MRMTSTTLIALIPLALACGTDTTQLSNTDGSSMEPTVQTPDCDGMARVLSPVSDGQSDFYFLDDIAFEVNKGEDEAVIVVVDADGETVSGSTWLDTVAQQDSWLRVVFTPEAPLLPSTRYTATLNYCGGSPAVEFSTSSLGTPLESLEDMEGRTFAIDLSEARITRPSQVAQALLALVDHDLLVQVDAATDSSLDLTMGAANKTSGAQDSCIPTLSLQVDRDYSSSPTLDLGPVDVDFSLAGYTITLHHATAVATFASDGTYFAGGRMSGSLDARDVVDALAGRDVLPAEDPEDLCEVIGRLGLSCSECADGEILCLDLEIQDVQAEMVNLDIEEIAQFDCHEDCDSSCDNDACLLAEDFAVCIDG